MKLRYYIQAAQILSSIFNPFYLPIVGLIILFMFSYLGLLPWIYKGMVLLMTYIFTILLPNVLIHWYRRHQGWSIMHLFTQEGRVIPYIISIASYFSCFYLMVYLHVPHTIAAIIMAALFIQIICAVLNIWFKISTHTAAIGGITGAMMAFSHIFSFNPLLWFSVLIIIGGLVGTARMTLRVHSCHQVVYGYLVGLITAFAVVITV